MTMLVPNRGPAEWICKQNLLKEFFFASSIPISGKIKSSKTLSVKTKTKQKFMNTEIIIRLQIKYLRSLIIEKNHLQICKICDNFYRQKIFPQYVFSTFFSFSEISKPIPKCIYIQNCDIEFESWSLLFSCTSFCRTPSWLAVWVYLAIILKSHLKSNLRKSYS